MTEIPEHLLKRAAEARARMTGEGAAPSDDAPSETAPAATAATPAVAAKAEVEPAAAPEPDPISPYAAAAKARKTIPVWVMPVLLFLPVWAIYYVGYLERPTVTGGLALEGTEVYSNCAGCHGGGGGGGSGRQLNDGQVTLTFPTASVNSTYDGLAGQLAWVANGSAATATLEGASTYGDPGRPGGAHQIGAELGNMSGFGGSLTLEELVAVVFHERATFGNLEAADVEAELAVLEEFIVVREEGGDVDLSGETVEQVHESLNEARANLGLATVG
ncbi:MAG: hypothetical protein R2695_07260 [Acidimicrobiales bacterium]